MKNQPLAALPPPGPEGCLDGLARWMQARRWRQGLALVVGVVVGVPVLMAGWLGLVFMRGAGDDQAAAAALNIVTMVFLVAVFLPLMHGLMYRWTWHVDRRRAAGSLSPGDEPAIASEPTEPAPRIAWPWPLRVRHAALYVIGASALLAVFLPYSHQVWIERFVRRHSAGSASAGNLNSLLFGYLPILGAIGVLMLLTYRPMRRRDAGLLDDRQQILLRAEFNWLSAFAAAVVATIVCCRTVGGMIVEYL